uniref:Peroxisomal membrane protein MPV17 n=1 Tax=Odontella aurita TaxID=265563 RepID=A0A7S4K7P4_9STRA|mmetsp:Transcript_63570/g.187655  ORF Transcript_63570/g.187655 Transcript_63570/m.187655 type:complete len:358 (+) Transcript_63570:94-1167(+)
MLRQLASAAFATGNGSTTHNNTAHLAASDRFFRRHRSLCGSQRSKTVATSNYYFFPPSHRDRNYRMEVILRADATAAPLTMPADRKRSRNHEAMKVTAAFLLRLSLTPAACAAAFESSIAPRSSSSTRRIRTSLNALALDLPGAVSAVDEFYRTAPLQSAFLTCGVKASMADAVAQRIDDDDSEGGGNQDDAIRVGVDAMGFDGEDVGQQSFSPLRNLAFILYGGLYTGCAQEIIFNEIYPRIFGASPSALTVAKEVAVDSFVVAPLLCLPIAYFTKAVVFNYSPREGLRRYAEDVRLKGLLAKYWALWIPVQTLTFTVVPEHLRIAFVAMVSFFWFIILSFTSDGSAAKTGVATEE